MIFYFTMGLCPLLALLANPHTKGLRPIELCSHTHRSNELLLLKDMVTNPYSFSANIKHILLIFMTNQGRNEVCKDLLVLLIKYLESFLKK